MATITESSSDRISNIRTFTQGVNINKASHDSAKDVLALEDACRELAADEQEKRYRQEGAPVLAEPKIKLVQAKVTHANSEQLSEEQSDEALNKSNSPSVPASGFNADASLIGSMATLRKMLHDGNLGDIRGRLQLINSENSALRQQGEKLLSELEKSLGELQEATDKANSAQQAWQQRNNQLQDLTQQQQSLEEQLADAEGKPETQQALLTKLAELKVQIDAAKQNTAQLESNMKQALALATEKAQQADQQRHTIDQFVDSAPRLLQVVEGERWENALAILTLLTAQLKKALDQDAIKNMRQEQEVMEAIAKATRTNSEKKAKEAEEAQRKADEASKAASCTSKVFGAIMLVISVVATVASFGTAAPLTLAIAAIGIAMCVADMVLEATGNSSLMQMLATEISNGISSMLIQFGVPEEQAKQIGGIVGMVLAAVVFLALSLFSFSSFARNAGTAVANVAKTMGKQVGNLLKSAVKSLPRSFTDAMGKVGNKVAEPLSRITGKAQDAITFSDVTTRRIEIGLNSSNLVMGATNVAFCGGLNLYASSQIRDLKELMAKMLLDNSNIQAIGERFKSLSKGMTQIYEQLSEMFDGLLSALNESGRAIADMMKNKFA